MKKHILFQGVLGTVLVILAAIDVSASSAAAMRRARMQAGAGNTQAAANVLASHTNVSAAEAATIGVPPQQYAEAIVQQHAANPGQIAEKFNQVGLPTSELVRVAINETPECDLKGVCEKVLQYGGSVKDVVDGLEGLPTR